MLLGHAHGCHFTILPSGFSLIKPVQFLLQSIFFLQIQIPLSQVSTISLTLRASSLILYFHSFAYSNFTISSISLSQPQITRASLQPARNSSTPIRLLNLLLNRIFFNDFPRGCRNRWERYQFKVSDGLASLARVIVGKWWRFEMVERETGEVKYKDKQI